MYNGSSEWGVTSPSWISALLRLWGYKLLYAPFGAVKVTCFAYFIHFFTLIVISMVKDGPSKTFFSSQWFSDGTALNLFQRYIEDFQTGFLQLSAHPD